MTSLKVNVSVIYNQTFVKDNNWIKTTLKIKGKLQKSFVDWIRQRNLQIKTTCLLRPCSVFPMGLGIHFSQAWIYFLAQHINIFYIIISFYVKISVLSYMTEYHYNFYIEHLMLPLKRHDKRNFVFTISFNLMKGISYPKPVV